LLLLLLLLQLHSKHRLQQQSKITQIVKLILTGTQARPIEDNDADEDANKFCKQQNHQSERNPNYPVTL
jgi:hypothetical protein